MGLLPTDMRTQSRKKLFSIFPYFSFSFFKYLIVSDQLYNWTCTIQNKLNIPAKDEFDISVQFRIMLYTNSQIYKRHTHTHIHIQTYTHTYTQTFSRKRIFLLRKLRNIEYHWNLGVEKFHRYKAFCFRKQKEDICKQKTFFFVKIRTRNDDYYYTVIFVQLPKLRESERVSVWWQFHTTRESIVPHNFVRVRKSPWWSFHPTCESIEPHNSVKVSESHRGRDSLPRASPFRATIVSRASESQRSVDLISRASLSSPTTLWGEARPTVVEIPHHVRVYLASLCDKFGSHHSFVA